MSAKNRYREKYTPHTDLFRAGNMVEVCSDEDGFKGAWYVATIVKSPAFSESSNPKRKPKVLVQYNNLISDADENLPLTEYVEPSFVRPIPPVSGIIDKSFEEYDVVDAFHRDGWWKGVVLSVKVIDEDTKRYSVFFENPPEELEFGSKDLRFHCEWSKGEWVRPPKQKRMEGSILRKGMEVEVNLNKENLHDAWSPAIIIEEIGFNSFLVEYSSSKIGYEDSHMREIVDFFHIRASPPRVDVKHFEILETVDVFYDSSWRQGLITKILTNERYNVFLKCADEEKQFSQSEIRPRVDAMNGTWYTSTGIRFDEGARHVYNYGIPEEVIQVSNSTATRDGSENQLEQSSPGDAKSITKRAKKRTPTKMEEPLICLSKKFKKDKSTNEVSLATLMQMEPTNQKVLVTDNVISKCTSQLSSATKPLDGFEAALMRKMASSHTKPKDGFEAALMRKMGHNEANVILLDEMEYLTEKEERGLNSQGEDQNIKGESAEYIIEIEHVEKYADSSAASVDGKMVSHAENSCQLEQDLNKKGKGVESEQQKGKKHNQVGDGASNVDFGESAPKDAQLSTSASMEPEGGLVTKAALVSSSDQITKEVNVVAVRASSDTYDDQALSVSFEGHGEREVENFSQNSAAGSELMNGQELPFVKSSPIWKNIESMEAFRLSPQKPHFGPLINQKVASREGFAIGHMFTFANIVENTIKLRVNEPRDTFDSYIEVLADLEVLGFEIKPVMDRLNRLLSLKDKQERLQQRAKDFDIQIEDCAREKTKLREDIDRIDKRISQLEEERATQVSMDVTKEFELVSLQEDANGIKEDLSKTMHEFESLVGSSL